MNRTQRVCHIVRLILVGALLNLSSLGFAEDAKYNRASLRGIKRFYVSVENLDPEIEKNGLTKKGIRKDVESWLRKAGIKTFTKKECFDIKGNPYLYVNINVLKLHSTKEYIYSIHVSFKQNVYSVKEPIIIIGAATWSTGNTIGITGSLNKIRSSINAQVDQFISAYFAVNPNPDKPEL